MHKKPLLELQFLFSLALHFLTLGSFFFTLISFSQTLPPLPPIDVQASKSEADPIYQTGSVSTDWKTFINSPEFLNSSSQVYSFLQNTIVPQIPYLVSGEDLGPLAIADVASMAWDLVVANKPVINLDKINASALPVIVQNNWHLVTGWKPERVVVYHLQVKNLYQMTVVDLAYELHLLAGGRVRGAGHYIASARVVPQIKVLWANQLDMSVKIPTIENLGTDDDPLAGIHLEVSIKVKNALWQSQEFSQSFLLQGDGVILEEKTNKAYFGPFTDDVNGKAKLK